MIARRIGGLALIWATITMIPCLHLVGVSFLRTNEVIHEASVFPFLEVSTLTVQPNWVAICPLVLVGVIGVILFFIPSRRGPG